ncbi:MAG: bifunctional DNA-formamidopyrimidine glycosylase/DNA-(apurinic or apyrimidinic site) lyase [Roseovarius sp.]
MPELPEVETVRRGLEPVMSGRRIARAEVNRPDLRWPLPAGLAARLRGRRVLALRRRSKYLLVDLDGDETLLVHLGMSGRILVSGDRLGRFAHEHPAPGRHDHVVLHLEDGARVTFNDPRRFGAMDLFPAARAAEHPLLARLGPEPLDNRFGPELLRQALAGRRAPVKSALMDQRIVAGLGNIYACEALHRAAISPLRRAGAIAPARIGRLAEAIRAVLEEAIAAGGSTLRDYRRADGELGYFQHSFDVYGRVGEACRTPGCGGTIRRAVQSGRATFYCPRCQR